MASQHAPRRYPPPISTRFHLLVMAVLHVVLLGWLLNTGQAILLPIFAAGVAVYVFTASARTVIQPPFLRCWPQWLIRVLLVLASFKSTRPLAVLLAGDVRVYERLPS